MKTIYTFTLDGEDYPSEQFKNNLRLFAYLLYDKLYNYDGEGFTPLNINRNIVYNNIHPGTSSREFYFDSDMYDDGYINYEPFLIGRKSFGLTIDDDTMNIEILQGLIREVLFISKLNCNVTINTVSYCSRYKEDEVNRRKAISQAYANLKCELPSRKFNIKAIYQQYERMLRDTVSRGYSYSRKKVMNKSSYSDMMRMPGR